MVVFRAGCSTRITKIGRVEWAAWRSNVSANEACVSIQSTCKRTKIIMRNLANKSQKPSRVHAAGKIKSACCDKHMKCTHTLCWHNIEFFKSKADDIYSSHCDFKWCIVLWLLFWEVRKKIQKYILLRVKVVPLATTKNSKIIIYCSP
jgi:hypothetical protein